MTVLDIRRIKYEAGLLFSSYVESVFFNWIIEGLVYLSLLLIIIQFVNNAKINLSFIIGIINVILFSSIGMGRVIFLSAIGIFVYAFILKDKHTLVKKKSSFPKVLASTLLFITFVCGGVVLTAKRLGTTITSFVDFLYMIKFTFNQVLVYYVGPFRALDYFLESEVYDKTGYMLGRATFSSLDEIFGSSFILMGYSYPFSSVAVGEFTGPEIKIGDNQTFNALYTIILNFYWDAGWLGVIILAFIFGAITALIYNYYLKSPNIYSFSLVVFFTYITTIEFVSKTPFGSFSIFVIISIIIIASIIKNNMKVPPNKD